MCCGEVHAKDTCFHVTCHVGFPSSRSNLVAKVGYARVRLITMIGILRTASLLALSVRLGAFRRVRFSLTVEPRQSTGCKL